MKADMVRVWVRVSAGAEAAGLGSAGLGSAARDGEAEPGRATRSPMIYLNNVRTVAAKGMLPR
jgi:hypothetical protein